MNLDPSYLKKRTTVAAVRRLYDFDSCDPEFRADWDRLLAKKQDGDELWVFEPPEREIDVRGVALVRKNRVVSTLVESIG